MAKMEQHDFYQILRSERKMPERRTTDRNVVTIQDAPQETFNKRPMTERVWLATKHKDLGGETRDFLWKSVQGTYEMGTSWSRIDSYEDRAVCPSCNERQDMDHILMRCRARV